LIGWIIVEFALRLLIGLPTNLGCVFISEMKIFRPWTKEKKGQTLVEYALIIAFISIVCIGVLIALGTAADNAKLVVISKLANAQASH